TAAAPQPDRPPRPASVSGGRWLLLQPHRSAGGLGGTERVRGGALPQRHCPVPAGAGKGPPVLWRDQVHPRTGSPGRFPSPVAEGQDLSRRLLSPGAFQGSDPNLLARGCPETAGPSAGGGARGLSHQQKRPPVLPAAGLSADHRPEDRCAGAAASLL